jgi:hypothetical protein
MVGVRSTRMVLVGVSVNWGGSSGLRFPFRCPSAMAAIILPMAITRDIPTINRLFSP